MYIKISCNTPIVQFSGSKFSPPFTPAKWRQEEKSQRWEEEGHFPRNATADQDIGGNPHGKNRQIHQQSPVENHRQEGANRIEVFPHLCKQMIIEKLGEQICQTEPQIKIA